jgi:hypothetical protein
MDAMTWMIISIVGYSLAGILLIVAIFMFIKMNIPAIVGDLTGRTAKREIQELREQNQSGNKRNTPTAFNIERQAKTRGFRTGALSKVGKTGRTAPSMEHSRPKTRNLETELLEDPNNLPTELLNDETALLNEEGTMDTVLLTDETVLLDDDRMGLDETTVLTNEKEAVRAVSFKIIKDIKVIHTNEVI